MNKKLPRAKKSASIRKLVVTGMLTAVSVVLGMTPLGFIPIPGMNLTTMHLPVILGAIVEGPIVGGILGLVFGAMSMYRAITTPTVLSPLFLNPLIAILPRLLIGPLTYVAYVSLKRLFKGRDLLAAGGAAFAGSLSNTVLVLGVINLFFLQQFADLTGMAAELVTGAIWLVALTNGVPEAIAAAVIIAPTERALSRLAGRAPKRGRHREDRGK